MDSDGLQDGIFVLLRHGQSAWNAQHRFTGFCDPPLTNMGRLEAKEAGIALATYTKCFDYAFSSGLQRARETLDIVLSQLPNTCKTNITYSQSLNERDYGLLSGMKKNEAHKLWGEAQVHLWRRSWSHAPPGGESLKTTSQRVIPFYEEYIKPVIKRQKKVIVVAHGNSIRALVGHIEELTETAVEDLEINTGLPRAYQNQAGALLRMHK